METLNHKMINSLGEPVKSASDEPLGGVSRCNNLQAGWNCHADAVESLDHDMSLSNKACILPSSLNIHCPSSQRATPAKLTLLLGREQHHADMYAMGLATAGHNDQQSCSQRLEDLKKECCLFSDGRG